MQPPPPPPTRDSDSENGGGGGSSIALHRTAKQWLDSCVNASTISSALPSSEYWRGRRQYAFYKHLHCVLQRYAGSATSALDVGSALPPFLNALPWLQSRTILGWPRFAGNVGKGGVEVLSTKRVAEKFGVTAIQADFLTWQPPPGPATTATATGSAATSAAGATATGAAAPVYDVVLCSEVVEHVPKPKEFVRKLLKTGRTVVLAVPYKWDPCDDTKCHHLNNKISRDQIAQWAGRQPHAYDVVEEASGEQRIICVYK